MALRQTKKISELPALSPASLDTTFVVGISGSTTYKISINNLTSSLDTTFATDLVTNALSNTLDTKLSTSSFNSYTSSFTASVASGTISGSSQLTSSFDTRYVVSGSITQTTWDNIANKPSGIVSQSTDLSSLNTFTASISTASLVNRLNAIESVSGSWITESETGSFLTSLSGAISSSTQISDLGFVTGSYTTINSFNSLTQSFNSISQSFSVISGSVVSIQGGFDTGSYQTFTTSVNTSISNLNTFTASVSTASLVTSISNLNTFTASQSTSSLVNRLNTIESVSGSWITESETGSFLTSLSGAISSSAQITTFGFVSGSYETTGRGIISSSANLVTTSSYNADSASFDSRINSITVSSGSNLTYLLEAYANVTYTLPGGFTEDPCRYSVVSATENVPSNWFNTSTYTFTPLKAGYWEINAAYDVYRNGEASMAIKKNGSIVAAAGSFNAVAQDISKTVYLNGSTDYINIINVGGAALQRDQYQSRSWFQAKFVGNISGSTDLPAGVISGSSQLTSSFDTRYVASGSISAVPAGTISGSSQLTSSFDTRYALSSSLSSISSSFNSRFNGLVTTGSNTFSGSQIFSGSMTVTSGQVIASTITNNSSSLFLQSGSNLYVQNNGIVEITGSLRVSGTTTFASVGGDEGGEIQFGVPTTNTTLQNRVTVDVWQNRLRIFEGSANANGVYIDLSKPTTGNNNEITYKASGIVNAGDFVQLDNIKATVTTSGQRGLSLATVSGTFVCNIGGNYAGASVGASGYSGTATITTSASTSIFGWGFTATGDFANYIITDTTNSRAYRIIIQIGASFNNNLVSIERLH